MTGPRTLLWLPQLGETRPLYLAILRALEEDVTSRRLHPGDRLPTQRDLARALGVGLGTVTRAYQEAERAGVISSRVGRGTFVALPPSTESLGLPDERRIEMSVDLPLHAQDPDLGAALRKLGRDDRVQSWLRYQDHAGTARHRQAGAAWAERFGVEAGADDVVVSAGSQHGVFLSLLTALEPGDLVLAGELTYPGLRSIARELRLGLHGVPMDGQGLIPEAVEALCRQRRVRALYCVPGFHNPTTRCLPEERRRALAELACEHDFVIIEDDVHRLVQTAPPPPLARLVPDRVYSVCSFSKAISGGLRVAFLVPPSAARPRMVDAVWASIWMAPPLMAEIAATWIEDGTADRVVAAKREEAACRQADAAALLAGARFETQPTGFYGWLHLPEPWTSADFVAAARARGVSVAPSTPFFIGAGRPPAAVRVCMGAAETTEDARRGLTVLADLLGSNPAVSPAAPGTATP